MSAPAPQSTDTVDGLALIRRRPVDHDPDAPTVVLVHGAMDRAASFARTMRRTGALDVVAYDRRGYAGSLTAGVAPDVATHARDLATVIDWSGARRVAVVGHSLGGTIGTALALSGDDRVVALAAFESPFPLLDDSFDQIGGGSVQIAAEQGSQAAAEHFYRLMVGEATWARVRERDRVARRAEGPALIAELTDLRRRDHAIDPSDLAVPLLVGRGSASSERMKGGAELLAAAAPVAALVEMSGAAHGAHLTHPDEFARFCTAAVALLANPGVAAPGVSF